MYLSSLSVKIIEQVDIFPKEEGVYKSFPTLLKSSDRLFLAFREGEVDASVPHGRNGRVRLYESKDAIHWEEIAVPFNDNELDAIISGPFGDYLFLWTRSFEYGFRNDVYISKFHVGTPPTERKKLSIPGASLCPFSHIHCIDGRLLAPAYGSVDKVDTPVILESSDFGNSWNIRSLITPEGFSPVLNETSILPLEDGFLAVIRSKEPSLDLYFSFSRDAVSWSLPEKTGLLGHAPMLIMSEKKSVVLVFRDLMYGLPGVGIAVTGNFKNWKYERIDSYTGDIYDGGYADVIELDRNELFVVYYLSDEDGSPWIRGTFLKIS